MRILRNRFLAAVAGTAMGLSISASAWACNTAEGAVAKVDTQGSTLVMKASSSCCGGSADEMKFALRRDTKITINGKEATLADLKAGDKIKVNYEKLDDVLAVQV